MASGGYLGGVLFDVWLSYMPSFVFAGISGLALIGALITASGRLVRDDRGSKTLAAGSLRW
jgi:hypothetical protein